MAHRDVVAIGTSAGGVEALKFLAENLPADLPAAVLVTIHLPSQHRSVLDEVLSASGPLPAVFASHGMVLSKGRIFIAPPDRHLILESDRFALGSGPRENHARPSIDAMLRSTALCCGPRSVGVVLTGALGDGASGLRAVHQCGGISVVQDPSDAAVPDMPLSALDQVRPDYVVRLRELPDLLVRLVNEPAGAPRPAPASIKFEVDMAKHGHSQMDELDRFGQRSTLACPDCGGVMWEMEEGDLVRFRCHVGHTYAAGPMNDALHESVRRAFASALRALEERVLLARRLERQSVDRGHRLTAGTWAERAREAQSELDVIRAALDRTQGAAE